MTRGLCIVIPAEPQRDGATIPTGGLAAVKHNISLTGSSAAWGPKETPMREETSGWKKTQGLPGRSSTTFARLRSYLCRVGRR